MFFKLLDKIRKKPEASKELIALGVSLVVGGIIAVAWAIYFIPHVGESFGKQNMANVVGPFNNVTDAISNNPFSNTETNEPSSVDSLSTDLKANDATDIGADSGQDTGQNAPSGTGVSY